MHVPKADSDQTIPWNGAAGRGWVEAEDLLDRLFQPFLDPLLDPVRADGLCRALDVGCGTGSTTIAIARRLGDNARCDGIDISQEMVTAARARAEREGTPASFICANAETYDFAPSHFDLIISRFGVMFFADPIRAFRNLQGAARDHAKLRFLAWRSAAENPFMTAAERAAAPLLPDLPVRRPGEPGQFAFADPDKVRGILEESGWADIEIAPIDVPCTLPGRDLVRYLTCVGPVARALQKAGDITRAQVVEAIRPAFDPYIEGQDAHFSAACWIVAASPGARFRTES